MKVAKYVGWISDSLTSREFLLRLGVKGKVLHSEEKSAFEHCEASEDVIETLLFFFPDFYAGAFTAVDSKGAQLPPEEQKYWTESRD